MLHLVNFLELPFIKMELHVLYPAFNLETRVSLLGAECEITFPHDLQHMGLPLLTSLYKMILVQWMPCWSNSYSTFYLVIGKNGCEILTSLTACLS